MHLCGIHSTVYSAAVGRYKSFGVEGGGVLLNEERRAGVWEESEDKLEDNQPGQQQNNLRNPQECVWNWYATGWYPEMLDKLLHPSRG